MSAPSETFVTEEIRDELERILEKEKSPYAGSVYEIELPDVWRDIWVLQEYPKTGEAIVNDEDGPIGKVFWTTGLTFGEDMMGTCVEVQLLDVYFVPKGMKYRKVKSDVAMNFSKVVEMTAIVRDDDEDAERLEDTATYMMEALSEVDIDCSEVEEDDIEILEEGVA